MCKKIHVKKLFLLPQNESGSHHNLVRIHSSWVDATRRRLDRFYRNETVCITNTVNNLSIIRQINGGGGIKGFTRDAIAIDYDGRDALMIKGVKDNIDCDLTVRLASWFEIYRYYYNHQDMGYQVSMRLGIIGTVLGIIGLLISLIPLF